MKDCLIVLYIYVCTDKFNHKYVHLLVYCKWGNFHWYIANSSQVELTVTSNTAQSWNFTCVTSKARLYSVKIFSTLPGGENKTCKNLKRENFPTQKFPNLRHIFLKQLALRTSNLPLCADHRSVCTTYDTYYLWNTSIAKALSSHRWTFIPPNQKWAHLWMICFFNCKVLTFIAEMR